MTLHRPRLPFTDVGLSASTAYDVVPHAIDVLQAAGYELVTVAECLGMDAYQSEGQPSERDDSWHC